MYLMLVLAGSSSPGPAVLFTITNSTLYGWKKTVFAMLGNIVGLFCIGVIAVTGLGTLLKTSEIVFNVVKYAGAAYLIYLGLKMFFQKNMDFDSIKNQLNLRDVSSRKLFFQALGVALSNPKAIVFITALFPQFINVNKPLIPQFSILIFIIMFFSFLFLLIYALLANKIKRWITKPNRINLFSRISGSIFIGFGLLLVTSSNK